MRISANRVNVAGNLGATSATTTTLTVSVLDPPKMTWNIESMTGNYTQKKSPANTDNQNKLVQESAFSAVQVSLFANHSIKEKLHSGR